MQQEQPGQGIGRRFDLGTQGFPRLMIFATLTCTPWHWVLVVPQPEFPNGFVNVTTGETHPIVW